jgi:hypothetical protein
MNETDLPGREQLTATPRPVTVLRQTHSTRRQLPREAPAGIEQFSPSIQAVATFSPSPHPVAVARTFLTPAAVPPHDLAVAPRGAPDVVAGDASVEPAVVSSEDEPQPVTKRAARIAVVAIQVNERRGFTRPT